MIFCGGFGTRISEMTEFKPKPLIEIGGTPIVAYIMQIYSYFGYNEFLLALGYKAKDFKDFFSNYYMQFTDIEVDLSTGSKKLLGRGCAPSWKISMVDTGVEAQTGGRLYQLRDHIDSDVFCLTYGDGVGNIDINKLVAFHLSHGRIGTVCAVRPVARFGELNISETNFVARFDEKPQLTEGWISGGFFVFDRRVFSYLSGSYDQVFEREPLVNLARDGQLVAYKHEGFWSCMDSKRDHDRLDNLARSSSTPPWLEFHL